MKKRRFYSGAFSYFIRSKNYFSSIVPVNFLESLSLYVTATSRTLTLILPLATVIVVDLLSAPSSSTIYCRLNSV
jgi:hypothetical protein